MARSRESEAGGAGGQVLAEPCQGLRGRGWRYDPVLRLEAGWTKVHHRCEEEGRRRPAEPGREDDHPALRPAQLAGVPVMVPRKGCHREDVLLAEERSGRPTAESAEGRCRQRHDLRELRGADHPFQAAGIDEVDQAMPRPFASIGHAGAVEGPQNGAARWQLRHQRGDEEAAQDNRGIGARFDRLCA